MQRFRSAIVIFFSKYIHCKRYIDCVFFKYIRVQLSIERAYLPDKITKEIETKLKTLFNDNINKYKVAVRSSATGKYLVIFIL